jgi:hypothetical protein
MKTDRKKPLWRKLNKEKSYKTHDLKVGAEYDRGTKDGVKRSMHTTKHHLKDYTPLYKYLLKHVGEDFDKICSDVYPRIDDRERIWDIIDRNGSHDLHSRVCNVGGNSYYSTLIIDEDNILQIKTPELKNSDLWPDCGCCTHTFNGVVYVNKFDITKTFWYKPENKL